MCLCFVDSAAVNGDSRSRAGFTLLELMVVMTLIAVLSLAVTPVFRGSFSSIRADHAMRDLFAAMKSAQSGAVTEAVEHRVYVDLKQSGYWLAHAARTKRGEVRYEPLPGRAGEVVELPDTVQLERPRARQGRDGEYYFSFFPSGACDVA